MNQPSVTTVTEQSRGITITPAPGWAVLQIEPDETGFSPLVLAPQEWPEDFGFRPSLTVVGVEHDPSEGVPSAHLAGTEALAVLLDQPDTHVLSYDLWQAGPLLGRVIRAALQEGELGLVTVQWVLVVARTRLTLTAMVDVDRYLRVVPLLEQMADSLQVADASVPAPTAEEPRRDPYLAHHGDDVEDLSKVPSAQTFIPGELRVGRESLLALAKARRGRIKADTSVIADLAQAGLVDEGGRLTDDGERVLAMMREPEGAVTVEAAVGLLPLSLQAWTSGGWTLIACTDAPTRWSQEAPHGDVLAQAPQRMHLLMVPAAVAPMTVASWVGLGPAWSLDVGELVAATDLVTQRVGDPSLPAPAGAGAHAVRAWEQPWIAWTLRSADPYLAVALVNAGSSGHLVVREEEDGARVRLASAPAAMVWDVLVEAFAAG